MVFVHPHEQSCPCKLLDYTLSKFLWFMSTGHLPSRKLLESSAYEIIPVAVVAFQLQYESMVCFSGHDGSCLIVRSIGDLLLCPDLRGDMELFLLPSKINLALSGQRSDYLPSLTPPSTPTTTTTNSPYTSCPSAFSNHPIFLSLSQCSPPPTSSYPPPLPVWGAVK